MTLEPEHKVGACWECGYFLRGLPTPRCPECGREFDPNDERTMNMGWEVRPVVKWLMRPPGWPTHLLTTLAVLMSIWAAAPMARGTFSDLLLLWMNSTFDVSDLETMVRTLADPRGRFLISAMLWLIVAVVWIGRRVARGITVKAVARQKAAAFAYWRRWLITPLVFGITALLCWSTLPIWIGFVISQPGIHSAVKKAQASVTGRSGLSDGWLGIYPPPPTNIPGGAVHWDGAQAAISISEDTWGRTMGYFVYRNDGHPPDMSPAYFPYSVTLEVRHLYGPWFAVQHLRYGR